MKSLSLNLRAFLFFAILSFITQVQAEEKKEVQPSLTVENRLESDAAFKSLSEHDKIVARHALEFHQKEIESNFQSFYEPINFSMATAKFLSEELKTEEKKLAEWAERLRKKGMDPDIQKEKGKKYDAHYISLRENIKDHKNGIYTRDDFFSATNQGSVEKACYDKNKAKAYGLYLAKDHSNEAGPKHGNASIQHVPPEQLEEFTKFFSDRFVVLADPNYSGPEKRPGADYFYFASTISSEWKKPSKTGIGTQSTPPKTTNANPAVNQTASAPVPSKVNPPVPVSVEKTKNDVNDAVQKASDALGGLFKKKSK